MRLERFENSLDFDILATSRSLVDAPELAILSLYFFFCQLGWSWFVLATGHTKVGFDIGFSDCEGGIPLMHGGVFVIDECLYVNDVGLFVGEDLGVDHVFWEGDLCAQFSAVVKTNACVKDDLWMHTWCGRACLDMRVVERSAVKWFNVGVGKILCKSEFMDVAFG